MVKRHHRLMLSLLRMIDLIVTGSVWALAYGMHILAGHLGWLGSPTHSFEDLWFSSVLSGVLMLFVFSRMGLYEPKRMKSLISEAVGIVQAVVLVWMIVYAISSFSTGLKLSRATMGLVLINWLVLGVLSRILARALLHWFRRRGQNLRHAVIVGTGQLAQQLYHTLAKNRWTGIEVSCFIDTDYRRKKLCGLDIVGPISELDSLVTQQEASIVFVALPNRQHSDMELALNRLVKTNADVRVVPDLMSFHFLRHEINQLDEIPIVSLTHSPQHGWNSVMKRGFDIVGSLAALILFFPLMAVIALLVRLTSRGGVFYLQKRASLSGRSFKIIKFRTMIENAEADTGAVWARSGDIRVTWIGRYLRRLSLDELPQFINVLLGQMSLVGPRPERPELIERFRELIPRYMLRSQVKAGLTGWAQIHGLRGRTSLRKRVQYDLYYISNWSFGLDMWVLFLSIFRGFIHPHAY